MGFGLAEDLPHLIWSDAPPPIEACHDLEALGDWLQKLELAAADARNHVALLWEMCAEQASERRSLARVAEQGQQ